MKDSHQISTSSTQLQFSIILVEPRVSKNIGAVARAMSNLGFADLRLVAPREFDREAALVTACWGSELIEQAAQYDTLAEAVADSIDVVGFSAVYGKNRTAHCTLTEYVNDYQSSSLSGKRSLVFGPEETGLRNEHIPYCSRLVRIPSHTENPSFNLSQAALIAMYELSKNHADSTEDSTEDSEGAPWQDYLYLEKQIDSILLSSGFQTEHTSQDVVRVIHGLFKRTKADRREMAMLLGLFGKIEKKLKEKL